MTEIAIVDDDIESIKVLEEMLLESANKSNIKYNLTTFTDGKIFEEKSFNGYKPDIIFLDIEIDQTNGVDIAAKLRTMGNNAIIIFITNYDYYVAKALRAGAFQYLKKPISKEDFDVDFNRAIELVRLRNNNICITINKQQKIVNVKDIYFFEVLQSKTYVCIKGKKILLDKRISLSKLMKLLDERMFVKTHHAILVNIHNIISISTDKVFFNDNIECSMSRAFKNDFMNMYNSYISGIKV